MKNRYAVSFLEDFPIYRNLEPGKGWDRNIERLHPRGKVGQMICESVPCANPNDVSIDDVERSEIVARRFDSGVSGKKLLTRVMLSQNPLTDGVSTCENELGINVIPAKDNGLQIGWHSSQANKVDAIYAVDSFESRSAIIGFLRKILLELTIANSPPVLSATGLWLEKKGVSQQERGAALYAKKISFFISNLEELSNNASLEIPCSLSEQLHHLDYVAFSTFVKTIDSTAVRALIDVWDDFMLKLINDAAPTAKQVAHSFINWPSLGKQLNLKAVENAIATHGKPGVNFLLLTPSERYREKKQLMIYEVIDIQDIDSAKYNEIKTSNEKDKVKTHVLKFYLPQ